MRILALLLIIYSSTVMAKSFYHLPQAKNYETSFYEVFDQLGGEHQIASHLWSNENHKLVLMVHGYLDNCAYLKPVQRWFLENKFDVLCIELPGHGNSSGRRADIPKMEVYHDIFESILPKIYNLPYQSFAFYGHSTGNTGMIEYLLENGKNQFDKIIMATPLIRSYQWKLSSLSHQLIGRYLSHLPRRPNSLKDPELKDLKKLDPFPISSVPTSWFQQLLEWNKRLEPDTRKSNEVVHAIFATKDTVIDVDFNKKFIEDKFPNSKINFIAGSDHILHWEKDQYRREFFQILSEIFSHK